MNPNRPIQTIHPSSILLPKKGIDLSRWAVIACDQYTSQPSYWEALQEWIAEHPSTYRLIFPEVYLHKDNDATIQSINQTMKQYLDEGMFEDIGESMILVERSTPYTPRRLGVVLSVDLEDYDWKKGSKSLIRATEDTIVERIPPRVKIREHATLEFPHTLLLIDDPKKHLIEAMYDQKNLFELVYDFELNMGGGHIRGYKITDVQPWILRFHDLVRDPYDPILFLVGDGNHSLATAKAHWETLKKGLSESSILDHPARFALVEVINLYDEGLSFEAIHRVVFNAGKDFQFGLSDALRGTMVLRTYSKKGGFSTMSVPDCVPECYKAVESYLESYRKTHPKTVIDYIHGNDHLIEVCEEFEDAVGIFMPSIAKADLFPHIKQSYVLPKKSFSMGHASEKRYYLESKKILK